MKNQFIITVAFIAVTSFTNSLLAQQPAAKTTGYDLKTAKGLSCSVVSTDQGCSLNFTKIEMSYRDGASGMATGKRQHKPFVVIYDVSSSDNSVSQVKSPRDAASGQATGKRTSSVTSGMSEVSSSSTVQGSGGGAGKVSMQDFHFSMKGNGKTISLSCPDGSCDISTDLPDGQYTLSCDWSWGLSQTGTMSSGTGGKSSPKRGSVDFLLDIENGACMAINQKGTGASNK